MEILTIGGRKFKPIKNSTFAHDIWIMERIKATGLDTLRIEPEESSDDFIDRIGTKAMSGGMQLVLELIAGVLMPDEIDSSAWTPEIAKATTKFFGDLTEESEKAKVRAQIGGWLYFFFLSAIESSMTSMRSGEKAARADHLESVG
jgi:hypothetical protein